MVKTKREKWCSRHTSELHLSVRDVSDSFAEWLVNGFGREEYFLILGPFIHNVTNIDNHHPGNLICIINNFSTTLSLNNQRNNKPSPVFVNSGDIKTPTMANGNMWQNIMESFEYFSPLILINFANLYNLVFNNGCIRQPAYTILEIYRLALRSWQVPAPSRHWVGSILPSSGYYWV